MVNSVKNCFLKKEFIVFILLGGINTCNGTVLAYVCSLFLQANLAFILGYITALTIAYFLNSFFVFYLKPQLAGFVKFVLSYIPNFVIQNALVLLLHNGLQWNKLLVYALAAAIGIPITFIVLNLFAFRNNETCQ